jgi:hypothetical protein
MNYKTVCGAMFITLSIKAYIFLNEYCEFGFWTKNWTAANRWDILAGFLDGYLLWQVEKHGYKPMHVHVGISRNN